MAGFGGHVKTNDNIVIEGAWHEIDTDTFRKQRRIPTHFDDSSITVALQAAVLSVHRQLQPLVMDNQLPEFDVIHIAVYKRAIFAHAHADLMREFATQDRREAAENTAEDSFEQADRFRAQCNFDIKLLLNLSPNTVALI